MHAFKSKNEEQICSVRSEKNGKKEKTLQSLRGLLLEAEDINKMNI